MTSLGQAHTPRRVGGAASWARPSLLKAPEWIESKAAPSAADIGTATHLALRLLDFRDAADEAAISRQIEQMVARRQLAPAIVAYIDLGSLAWLAGTELGGLLAAEHDRLLRELPVRVPADAAELVADWQGTADGPLDRVLLRGQVDVVIPLE